MIQSRNRCSYVRTRALARIPATLAELPRTTVPLAPFGLLGADALRAIAAGRLEETASPESEFNSGGDLHIGTLPDLIEEIAHAGRGVVLTMGKGGVGKTTVAAAVAVALADRGFPVHLSTTDPAAHLAAALNGTLPNLQVGRIDPRAEVAAYTAEVMATAGANLDEHGRALLQEDLRSPCTEEIAVFRAFAAAVDGGREGFVVLDTAPTGHTVLLLDAALAYHREISRQASGLPESVQQLLPRLRDSNYTRVLIVTLPEATPVHEAAQLQRDLNRAGIKPFGWAINQSLSTLDVRDLILLSRQRQEAVFLREVAQEHASRVALIPWQVEPPVGIEGFRRLVADNVAEPALQE